ERDRLALPHAIGVPRVHEGVLVRVAVGIVDEGAGAWVRRAASVDLATAERYRGGLVAIDRGEPGGKAAIVFGSIARGAEEVRHALSAREDLDHATHRVGAVEARHRPLHDLDALDHVERDALQGGCARAGGAG